MSATSPKKVSTPSINDRIECDEQFGTIKYIGAIDGQPDTWLGIDWDSPTRGKHNGTVDGKQYFRTRFPTSGSFVRPQKVNFGQSLIRAITSRYGSRDDELTAKINNQKLLKLQQEMNAPFVQFVGFDGVTEKQSDLKNLQVVFARMQSVNRVSDGADGELGELCPNIVQLDVSKNLISKWDTIFTICQELVNLEWLNVSENFVQPLQQVPDDCFCTVKTLVCGSMNLTWDDLVKLTEVFPSLEELRAPNNNITQLNTPPDAFNDLKVLDLEGNRISDWPEVCKLSAIPNLEQLNLDNTDLQNIKFEKCDNQGLKIFPNLKKLSISDNAINDWESIGELNKLKNLEDLKFQRNPILEAVTPATRDQIVIAKLATLKSLSSAMIEPGERKGAEFDYLKRHGLEWLDVRDDPKKKEDFLQRHNRYTDFIDEYGELSEDELRVPENNVKTMLVDIVFQYGGREINKKIPKTIVIQKLIVLAQKLFALSEKPTLLYVCTAKPEIHVDLDDEGKELNRLSVTDGDKIVVVT